MILRLCLISSTRHRDNEGSGKPRDILGVSAGGREGGVGGGGRGRAGPGVPSLVILARACQTSGRGRQGELAALHPGTGLWPGAGGRGAAGPRGPGASWSQEEERIREKSDLTQEKIGMGECHMRCEIDERIGGWRREGRR
ncbi:hypothetical protein CRUP_008981 [Coryphaenoides rupestris]|nr:hypothetical protein CRUP_008981 [Coryphaenoides rupestris]